MNLTTDNALFGHTDEDTAYYVEDYPYGFRLRTTIRYWLETNAKHGDRFVSQTLNPKTARWNKPKKSTYVQVGCLYLDNEEHVTWTGIRHWVKDEDLASFLAVVRPHLNDHQLAQVAAIKGMKEAFKDVTFDVTFHEGPMSDEDKAEQDDIKRHINRRIAVETSRATFGLMLEES